MLHKVKIRGTHNGACYEEGTIYVDGPDSWRGHGVGPGSGEPFDRAKQVAGPSWQLTSACY
jgi:hypothetical protein